MAGRFSGQKIGDTEQLEWLSKSFHGLIIGKRGSGLKEIKGQTGGQASFLDDKCVVTGNEEQVNLVKTFISQKVKKQEAWYAKRKGMYGVSCVPSLLNMENEPWEIIDIHPKYYKCISDEGLQTKYGVNLRLRKNEKSSHIVVQGTLEAKTKIKQWFKEFETKQHEFAAEKSKQIVELVSGKDCETINMHQKYFGRILGKGGSIKKGLETKHNVVIIIDSKNNVVHIKGDEDARKKTKLDIEHLIFDDVQKQVCGESLTGSSKDACFVGLTDNEEVVITSANCLQKEHCKIVSYPQPLNTEKTYSNINGLKELITKPLERVKAECDMDPKIFCDVMIHSGLIHCKYRPGSYKISTLRSDMRLLEYERFSSNTINFNKLKRLPVLVGYVRFDLKIFATHPSTKIRYKIFVDDSCENPTFMDIKEIDICSEEVLELRAGPGYFCHPEHRCSRIDIIDPSSNFTTRINISLVKPNEEFSNVVKTHVVSLKDFFENIKVKKADNKVTLVLPELSSNYKVTFMRRSERRCYKFAKGCILRTSKEEHLFGESTNNGENVTDVFYKNENLVSLLQNRSWSVDQLEEMVEEELVFSDTMLQYLL